jgi:two-component system, LytTR family, sensor kinase
MVFLLRLSVVTLIHLIFKEGDLTFTSAFEGSTRSLLFSVYFIIYWLLFWEACSAIYKRFIRFASDKKLWYRRLFFITIVLFLFGVICTMIFNWLYLMADYYLYGNIWKDIHFINPQVMDSPNVLESIKVNPELLYGIMLFFILVYGAHVFITSMRNVKEMEIVSARQKKESIMAQYSALKNQIDPHFFFNSLSVLSSLIYESTELSALYISHLSKHYRYILEMNAENLVSVGKELEFLESYFFLIKIRHQDYIVLTVNIADSTRTGNKILPHALQMLVENAVKHNIYKKDNQLKIEILEDEDHIIIRNNINKRRLWQKSTGIGLQNIKLRYAIEGNHKIIIEETDHDFIVKLPKIK